MRPRRCEDGFTLIEMIVVTAIIVIVAGTLGTFFLAGASPAVAAAGRDVTAAFDEAHRTAIAFDAATVVFAPAQNGSGYSARIYARVPGDPGFAPRNGPTYDSTVTISETASPLGAPGFAFTVDSHGTVTGYAGFSATATTFTSRPCPATGTFTLHLAYERDVRIVTIPCQLGLNSATPAAFETPAAAYSATPFPIQTCPATVTCSLALLAPVAAPSLPPASTPSPASNPSATLPVGAPTMPAANPTACPAGFSGAAPGCAGEMIEQYEASADGSGGHSATLFANGSICDDDGCSLFGAIAWTWGCAPSSILSTSGTYGRNLPYQQNNGFQTAVGSMLGYAFHDAGEGSGDGIVYSYDAYCAGFPPPDP
jgi:prepilin-type N-terminal cleavage/methylation domain-containing protein